MIYVHNGTDPVAREGKPGTEPEQQPFVRVYEADAPESKDHRGYLTLYDALKMEPEARGIITLMMGGESAVH